MGTRGVETISSNCDCRGRRVVNTTSGRGGAAVSNPCGELVSLIGSLDFFDNPRGRHTLGMGKGKVEAAYSPAPHCSHGPCAGAAAAAPSTRSSPRVWSTSRRRRTETHCLERAGFTPLTKGKGKQQLPRPSYWLTPRGGPEAGKRGVRHLLSHSPRRQQGGLMPVALAAHWAATSPSEGRRCASCRLRATALTTTLSSRWSVL
jgi:hypothetical protein